MSLFRFKIGRLGTGRRTNQQLIIPSASNSSFITLESSLYDFLLTEDGLFIDV
jgi:hypothetical protein